MRPICVPCGVMMACDRNGYPVKDAVVDGFESTVWFGDLYGCPGCGARIVTGLSKAGTLASECPRAAAEALEFKYA